MTPVHTVPTCKRNSVVARFANRDTDGLLSERLVNECEALFFPARASEANQSVGLLLAGLQSSTLLHRFRDWTEAWQDGGLCDRLV